MKIDDETDDDEDGSRSRQPTITHMSSLGGAAEVDRVSTEEVETTSKEECLLGSSVWYTSCYQTKTYMLSSLLSTSLKKEAARKW